MNWLTVVDMTVPDLPPRGTPLMLFRMEAACEGLSTVMVNFLSQKWSN